MSSIAFQDAASASSSALGVYSVTFQSVRLGFIWTGSVQIPSAVSSSVLPVKFTAFDSGIPIGSWYNDQSSPNLQVQQQLSITASGLATSTKFQAFFKGMITPAAETQPFWPGPTPAPPASGPFQLIDTQTSLNPTVLVSGGQVQVLAPTPVVVGTSLEVRYFSLGGGMNAQLQILWSASAAASASSEYTFDVNGATSAVLSGLVLPNLDSFVTVVVASAVAASPVCRLSMLTGLPPIVRSPLVMGGVLIGGAFGNIAVGESSFALPPYVGPATFGGELASAAANGIDLRVVSADYLGNLVEGPWAVSSQVIAGTSDNIPPYQIYLPPKINSLVVANRTGGIVQGSYYVITAGP